MRTGARFVEEDLNRLFNSRHESSSGPEALRACELEHLAETFFSPPGRTRLHYDLHGHSRVEDRAVCVVSLQGGP